MKPLWIKWYPVQWLHSTARDEMSAAERATFQDFVCLASISSFPGRFKFVGEESLARTLNTDPQIVKNTIKVCLERKRISIKKDKEGYTIKILKYHIYQPLSPVDSNPKNENVKVNDKSDSSSLLFSSLYFSFSSLKWEGIGEGDKKAWAEAYPACNIEIELRKMGEWLKANPSKKKVNYRRFIVSWLSKSQDQGGTKGIVTAPGERMFTKLMEKERNDKLREQSGDK